MPTSGENSRVAGLGDRELILERLLAENNLVLELIRDHLNRRRDYSQIGRAHV